MSKRRKHVELGTPIDLDMSARYFTFNRQYAVKDVIDGLVELITNSDDSYHRLYRAGQRTEDGGPILIQLFAQRGGKTSELQVRDRAEGMALQEMVAKLGTIGERASENGDRGFMARGARDCTELGEMYIESIKGDRYYACRLTTNAQLIPEADGNLVDNVTRQRLGIRQRENGTVITVTVAPHHHMPRLSSLVRDLPWHFALRHILAEDSDTRVMVTNANRPDDDPQCIVYRCPEGELVVDTEYEVAGYDGATAHLKVWRG
jgi:hypothetical protein